MIVKYKGTFPIKFVSMKGFSGVIAPDKTFEIDNETYNSEYKNDNRFEPMTKTKKIKGDE